MNPVAPTAAELLRNPSVIAALEGAWNDSLPEDSQQRHEEGGWIYYELSSGMITVVRAAPGRRRAINLSQPPELAGCVVVGKFHTHPNPTDQGWDPAPSDQDELIDNRDGVPDLIRSDQGVFVSGPDSRRGGLGGLPGFPS
ncbi:MAG TPA: hypothetical protein VKE40_14115 [Gemmataceae bacterium]|nr:hypothetical protein [Gemmataceae bacterium]